MFYCVGEELVYSHIRIMVSIIIPVYNAEQYIAECLKSLSDQTFCDFEVLIVDDGSNDLTPTICQSYAVKDPRFKYFSKKNGGVSSARNFGLKRASGEWIAFVDADDNVSPSFLSAMYAAVRDGVDLVVDSFSIIRNDSAVEACEGEVMTLAHSEMLEAFTKGRLDKRTSPWGKLYKSDIIRSMYLSFNEKVHLGEDAIFLFEYLLCCSKVSFIDNRGYFYRLETSGSLTKTINTLESELEAFSKISSLTSRLIAEYDNNDKIVSRLFKELQGFYVRRVLSSLYVNPTARELRLATISQLPLDRYITYYPVDSMKERVYKVLLSMNFYGLYDALRIFVAKTNRR